MTVSYGIRPLPPLPCLLRLPESRYRGITATAPACAGRCGSLAGYSPDMRKIAIWVGVLSVLTGAQAVNNASLKPSFAELSWYSTKQDVQKQMSLKGYTFARELKDAGTTDVVYNGKILGVNAQIQHYFNPSNQLVKTSIVFERSFTSNIYTDWNYFKSNLEGKYGLGIAVNNVEKGYTSSNTMLDIALNDGSKLSAYWRFPTYNYFVYLDVSKIYINDNDYYLNLGYESPAWTKELQRRRNGGDL